VKSSYYAAISAMPDDIKQQHIKKILKLVALYCLYWQCSRPAILLVSLVLGLVLGSTLIDILI
jgi:hypothetical protein